ncbi:MAG: MBL fold metallo-hydrolase [Gemmataceae bacterium]
MGRAGGRAPAGTAVPDRPGRLPAARPVGRRRADGPDVPAVQPGRGRPGPPGVRPAGRRHRPRGGRLAISVRSRGRHAPGHVSLFRDSDRTLIAGDAVVTTRQESALAAAFKPKVVSGPPAYFTIDWVAAAESARKLAALRPETLATGHGVPMHGERMRHQLNRLAARFEQEAVPSDGRYVRRPARMTGDGRVSVPPAVGPSAPVVLAAAGAALAAGYLVGQRSS